MWQLSLLISLCHADPRLTDYDLLLENIKSLKSGQPAQVCAWHIVSFGDLFAQFLLCWVTSLMFRFKLTLMDYQNDKQVAGDFDGRVSCCLVLCLAKLACWYRHIDCFQLIGQACQSGDLVLS